MRMIVETAARSLEEVVMCVQLFLAAAWEQTLLIEYRKQSGSVVRREVAPRKLWRSSEGRLLVDVWDLSRDDYRTFAVENFLASAPSGHTDYFADLAPKESFADRAIREVREQVWESYGFDFTEWPARYVPGDSQGFVEFTHPDTRRLFTVLGVEVDETGRVLSSAAVDESRHVLL